MFCFEALTLRYWTMMQWGVTGLQNRQGMVTCKIMNRTTTPTVLIYFNFKSKASLCEYRIGPFLLTPQLTFLKKHYASPNKPLNVSSLLYDDVEGGNCPSFSPRNLNESKPLASLLPRTKDNG